MNAVNPTIATADLRVGMFVHLDLSWISHPFALSSFRIADPGQIATIRSLGLAQVRWCPDKSDPAPLPETPAVLAEAEVEAGAASVPADLAPAADSGPARLTSAESSAKYERRRALAAQRAVVSVCKQQYGEATQALRHAEELADSRPRDAGQRVAALSRALVDKMLAERELSVRVVTELAGDRASQHALNVGVIALLMGKLCGLPATDMLDLGVGALCHDIGKRDLPRHVQHLHEGLGAADAALYRDHVARGVAQGRRMELAPGALLVIAQHHEQCDGQGFPQGLNMDRMSVAARVVALVNRYDNLCNPVHPGHAMTPHDALAHLFAQGKSAFDSTMLTAFIRMMGVYPPGSVVQLTDDRYALVTSVNSARPLKPKVLVHDAKVPRDEALYLDLEQESALGIRRSLPVVQLPPTVREYLSPPPRVAWYFEAVPAAERRVPYDDEDALAS